MLAGYFSFGSWIFCVSRIFQFRFLDILCCLDIAVPVTGYPVLPGCSGVSYRISSVTGMFRFRLPDIQCYRDVPVPVTGYPVSLGYSGSGYPMLPGGSGSVTGYSVLPGYFGFGLTRIFIYPTLVRSSMQYQQGRFQ